MAFWYSMLWGILTVSLSMLVTCRKTMLSTGKLVPAGQLTVATVKSKPHPLAAGALIEVAFRGKSLGLVIKGGKVRVCVYACVRLCMCVCVLVSAHLSRVCAFVCLAGFVHAL